MPDILTQDIDWDEMQSATTGSNPEIKEDAEVVSRKTLEDLDKKGWCLWRCRILDDQVITVVRDSPIFRKQLRFSDPLRVPASYPVFTVDELHYLAHAEEWTIRMVYESKKLAPAEIEVAQNKEE